MCICVCMSLYKYIYVHIYIVFACLCIYVHVLLVDREKMAKYECAYVYVWVCKCIYLYIFILYLLVWWRLWLWTPLSQCLSAACKTMWVPILEAGWLWAWFQSSTRKKLLGWVTTAWPTWNCTPTHCPDAPVPQCPSGGMECADSAECR